MPNNLKSLCFNSFSVIITRNKQKRVISRMKMLVCSEVQRDAMSDPLVDKNLMISSTKRKDAFKLTIILWFWTGLVVILLFSSSISSWKRILDVLLSLSLEISRSRELEALDWIA